MQRRRRVLRRLGSVSGQIIQRRYLKSTGRMFPGGGISEHLREKAFMNEQVYEQLTLFPEDSPVSHSRRPGSEEARKTTVISGRKCAELLRKSDPVGLLAKMLLESSDWRSTRCYLTWKASATPSGRLLFRLVPSTPRTEGIDAQSWPTPTAEDRFVVNLKSSEQNGTKHSLNLANAVELFPTARSRDWKGPGYPDDLPSYVSMYPTPTTGAGLCGGSGNYQQLMKLKEQGQITEEERRNMSQGNGGQLNPTFVEWLMGFPLGWTDLNA